MRARVQWALGIVMVVSVGSPVIAQSAGAGGRKSACSLLSGDEILQISKKVNRLGMKPRPDEVNGVSECGFVGYELTLVGNQTAQSFDALRKGQSAVKNVIVQPVAGVGDDAFYSVWPASFEHTVAISIRVGSYRLAIQEMVPADSVEIIKPTLLALAKAAVPRLR